MAKDPAKSGSRAGRAPRARRGLSKPDRRASDLSDRIFRAPETSWAVLIWVVFILVCAGISAWARQQPLVAVGRVMNDTALVRVPLVIENEAQTEQRRELARQQTLRVYRPISSVFETIRTSVENLPKALENAETVDQVVPEIRNQFRLTGPSLDAIRAEVVGNEVSAAWREKTKALVEGLMSRPLLDDATLQRESQEGLSREVQVHLDDAEPPAKAYIPSQHLVSIKDERQLTESIRRIAAEAGFTEPALTVVVSRLTTNPEPTFRFDEAATAQAKLAAAKAVKPIPTLVQPGQKIFERGEELKPQQLELYRMDLAEFRNQAESWRTWLRTVSILGAVTAIALAVAGYLALFCPRVRKNPVRTAGIAGLLAAALGLACAGTVASPALLTFTAIAPTIFVAVILVIAYDQRVALAIGTLHGVLVCIALDQPIGVYALILTGVSFAVLQLSEIRDRRGIIRMGLYAAAALSVGTVLVALIDRPIIPASLRQTLVDAALAGAGGMSVGVLTLALLPTIEKAFDITTGMTLIELRDPKQPLLRQLQQRAPGTYNHSLNVASIAEAAADAIKADGLLTYVGALYHDIGKMNKPDYFVENQSGGPNKHDKLSPAMSLLVIVGHVKDGMAMAQEAGLPRSLQHFIEAHHGTTLVEFFYNRARKQAEQSARGSGEPEPDLPEEIEYRYPGPRPRTKECAILMLADAVESATRSMAEPTPSRIDALVRALANKRLMDGQFDECELTLHDLQTISESISKSVASIYHGRVLYPSTASLTATEEKRA